MLEQTALSPYQNTGWAKSPSLPFPDNKVHGAKMGPIWGRQDPGGPHVGPLNFAIWVHKVPLLVSGYWSAGDWAVSAGTGLMAERPIFHFRFLCQSQINQKQVVIFKINNKEISQDSAALQVSACIPCGYDVKKTYVPEKKSRTSSSNSSP